MVMLRMTEALLQLNCFSYIMDKRKGVAFVRKYIVKVRHKHSYNP